MAPETTRISLLSRVRDPANQAAWREFDARYSDLIVRYCRSRGLQAFDAEDVRQVVLLNLAKALRSFEYCPGRGKFRSYLGSVVRNSVNRHLARPNREVCALPTDSGEWSDVPAAADDEADQLWKQEWMRYHYRLAMESVRATSEPRSLEVFERLVAGDSIEQVAMAFDMSPEAVHKVKQRVRDRLKEQIAAQIIEEDNPDGPIDHEERPE